MSNKGRLILFAVFAMLTFYQFYTYAKSFRLSDFSHKDVPTSITLSGIGGQDVRIEYRAASFDASILLLVLNIVLWVERPTSIERRWLILAFIANLFIVIVRIGFGIPALKQALADFRSNPTTYSYSFPQWNALYLAAATISSLIVIGLLIQVFRKR